jgi:hypothetical protein
MSISYWDKRLIRTALDENRLDGLCKWYRIKSVSHQWTWTVRSGRMSLYGRHGPSVAQQSVVGQGNSEKTGKEINLPKQHDLAF